MSLVVIRFIARLRFGKIVNGSRGHRRRSVRLQALHGARRNVEHSVVGSALDQSFLCQRAEPITRYPRFVGDRASPVPLFLCHENHSQRAFKIAPVFGRTERSFKPFYGCLRCFCIGWLTPLGRLAEFWYPNRNRTLSRSTSVPRQRFDSGD